MLRKVVKDARLRAKVLERAEEFKLNNSAGESTWYRELVLCILTSNSTFISAFSALQSLNNLIFAGTVDEISAVLKKEGYRFPNLKAKYIVKSRSYLGHLKRDVKELADKDQIEAREYLLEIDGIGMKEASHFLRNVGYFDVAIIDRHILKFFFDYIAEVDRKSLSKNQYLYYENILKSVAYNFNIQVGIMDLYIWFIKTGKIAK
ncbi:N-glycosylase/DNA lyase [Metallosphaera tengchongensis]|uniref:8-oxoguanine DNA glycosylase/AP lyase n=1 Tax=Metallosphaera tengchongensis TaxID=1532350 RepID=A0A6N0NT90_9CREN|nr:N-glycosylase/DNA lyase [Metallosphaera tengchongensis]QKQ99326.1 N-glycosylase/DNA lyase [Metallosphaera tengchongensis]